MRTIPINEVVPDAIHMHGALDFDHRDGGLSPRRLPAWTRLQMPQTMDVMVRLPSGVRLRFATDSRSIGIAFHATNMVNPRRPRRPVVFNLETDGALRKAASTRGNALVFKPEAPGGFELVRGDADTLVFENLPPELTVHELWLPHNAFVELHALVLDDGATLQAAPADARPRWIHYGSSISHCMEADEPAGTWPAVAARLAGACLQSFGFGGQCHLDQFVARTMRAVDADLISVKTGINVVNMDSMRERVFVPALHGFLDTLRESKPEVPIAVISPIFCPSAETRPGPTVPNDAGKFVTVEGFEPYRFGCLTLTRVREVLAEAVEQRRAAGDTRLHYVDGLTLFGAEDAGDLPDDLHPNPAGYQRMGERFAPTLKRLLAQGGD